MARMNPPRIGKVIRAKPVYYFFLPKAEWT